MHSQIDYQGKPLIEQDKETIIRLLEGYVAMSRKQMDDQMTRDRKQILAAGKHRNELTKESFMAFLTGVFAGALIAIIAIYLFGVKQ